MARCTRCAAFFKSVRNTPVVTGDGLHPSTLELAYMVNLEYYMDIDIGLSCTHEIPEVGSAKIKIKEMVDFLDNRKWEMVSRTNDYGFKCSSFLNRPSKQLVIVHRGTENWAQVCTDIRLALDIITQKIIKMANWHTSQSLLNGALKQENQKFVRNDFSITVTGHSLGGWIAQICTLLSRYPEFHPEHVGPLGVLSFGNGTSIDMSQSYELHCVTFDSPGASTLLNRLEDNSKAAHWLVSGSERDVEDALSTLDITVYLSNPNLVNKCGTHFGKVERIDVMSGCSFWEKMNPFASHSMERILGYFKRQN